MNARIRVFKQEQPPAIIISFNEVANGIQDDPEFQEVMGELGLSYESDQPQEEFWAQVPTRPGHPQFQSVSEDHYQGLKDWDDGFISSAKVEIKSEKVDVSTIMVIGRLISESSLLDRLTNNGENDAFLVDHTRYNPPEAFVLTPSGPQLH